MSVSSGSSPPPSPSSLLTKALGSHLAVSDSRLSRLAPIERELMNSRLDSVCNLQSMESVVFLVGDLM